jgi:hypothetical protein
MTGQHHEAKTDRFWDILSMLIVVAVGLFGVFALGYWFYGYLA